MEELLEEDPELSPPFGNTVFACTAFNFGPNVVSREHKDHLNLAFGWCSITALGKFDHEKGGHLVLPELKLAVEFPAGSTVFIPSAALTHYNLPIVSGEQRHSTTQFTAGGLFRWIAYGYQEKGCALAASVEQERWWETKKGLYAVWPTESVTGGPGT